MTRRVGLPECIPGSLYLSEMPGRFRPLAETVGEIAALGVSEVISLAPMQEIAEKSPGYALAIGEGALGCRFECVPVPDFGIPADEAAYRDEARRAAGLIRRGETILVHCGAGIGRTGTFALCVLAALGMPGEEASEAVSAAGSGPETAEQSELVGRMLRTAAGA